MLFLGSSHCIRSLHSLKEQRGSAGDLGQPARTWSTHERPAQGHVPRSVTSLKHRGPAFLGTGGAQGMQRGRKSQQWWGAQCSCIPGLWVSNTGRITVLSLQPRHSPSAVLRAQGAKPG